MTRRFSKMQAVGNDFIVVDPSDWGESDWENRAIELCERRHGIGADGLLLIEPSLGADFRMRMFNPDGTEDDCGNGLRCAVRYAYLQGRVLVSHQVETLSGNHDARIVEHDPKQSLVRVSMGQPLFHPSQIPMEWDAERVVDCPLPATSPALNPAITPPLLFTCLNTGSTHAVTFLDGPVQDELFQRVSPAIEHHPLFPRRTSVIWAWPDGDQSFTVRIWERGVGETLGCGTGACATAVAATVKGLSRGDSVIRSAGGQLHVQWTEGHLIWMTGPAVSVFEGKWGGAQ